MRLAICDHKMATDTVTLQEDLTPLTVKDWTGEMCQKHASVCEGMAYTIHPPVLDDDMLSEDDFFVLQTNEWLFCGVRALDLCALSGGVSLC